MGIMDIEARIQQFANMVEADPDNELGHFSLGKALLDAGRFSEAVRPLQRTLQLNPTYSKAYHLLGRAQLESGLRQEALVTLKRGYEVAAERGDVMPRNEIATLLAELGEALPDATGTAVPPAKQQPALGGQADGFQCSRCGRPHGKMPERPFKGPLGEKILACVCQECWREWIGMGTKVINEMGLQLSDPRSQSIYDEYMKEFLQIED